MRSALYYPHTEIRHENSIKNSLLLWDKLEFIVPFDNYEFQNDSKLLAEAMELIGHKRCPSNAEKMQAHSIIEDFATGPLPDIFFYADRRSSDYFHYSMWPHKLLPETWEMLTALRLIGKPLADSDFPLEDSTGLALMSILADCCAGKTLARITDRAAAYAALTNLFVDKQKSKNESDRYDKIVPITLNLIKISDIPLENLISLRKRETNTGGYTIRNLRHGYLDKISEHIKFLGSMSLDNDIREVNRQFELDMSDDLKFLRQELRAARWDVALSKEVVVSTIAAAGGFLAATSGLPFDVNGAWTVAGAVATAGGIAATVNKYKTSRITTMKKHPMAYLYELQSVR